MKLGDKQKVILELENGKRVIGVGIVTECLDGDDSAFTITIPNMHISIQDGKLVKHVIPKDGFSGYIGADTYSVDAPLMNEA